MRPDGIDGSLDPRKMTTGTAFDHAAAGRAPEASHEQGFEKSVEKCADKSMTPYMAL
jgi:hypothetical protein